MYARNVRGLSLSNVRFEAAKPDLRPAVVFDHVEDASLIGFAAQGNPEAESVMRLADCKDVLISGARLLTPASLFLKTEGSNGKITLEASDLSKASAK
jgi:hypothetical protein